MRSARNNTIGVWYLFGAVLALLLPAISLLRTRSSRCFMAGIGWLSPASHWVRPPGLSCS